MLEHLAFFKDFTLKMASFENFEVKQKKPNFLPLIKAFVHLKVLFLVSMSVL